MKYLVSYVLTATASLFVYYVAFYLAAFASYLTNGLSTYLLLILMAAVSGLMGPITLYSKKDNKKSKV